MSKTTAEQKAALIARIEILEGLALREYQLHVREVAECKQALSEINRHQ